MRLKALIAALGITISAMAANPAFPGGDAAMQKYIEQNLKYPEAAKSNGIEGVINVAFTVKADGSIGGIKIVRMVDPDLEQEAIRLVKNMPAWTPASENGKPVDSTATIKIDFTLPSE